MAAGLSQRHAPPHFPEAAEKTTDEPSRGAERLLPTTTIAGLAVFLVAAPFPVGFLFSVTTT